MASRVHVEALNLRHLRAWATVVEEGSVTAGAKKLGVSQPALSQQLKNLETFFGAPLLERLPRGIKPTPLGRALLARTRATLSASESLIRQAISTIDVNGGVLEIATLPTLVEGLMMEPLKMWKAKHPEVSIRIREFAIQGELVEEFRAGLADVALGVRPRTWTGSIWPLGWDEFVVLLPQNHPRYGFGGPINLQDLADDRWVLYDKSHGLSEYVSAVCASAGFTPFEAVRTSQASVAIQLACVGLGAALVPRLNVPKGYAHHMRALAKPFAWEIVAFSRSEFSEAAENFVNLIDRHRLIKKPRGAVTLPG